MNGDLGLVEFETLVDDPKSSRGQEGEQIDSPSKFVPDKPQVSSLNYLEIPEIPHLKLLHSTPQPEKLSLISLIK
jgi:hypothetical protein